MNFSLYVLLCRKHKQENKAMAVVEQMSPNMEQLKHSCITTCLPKDLKLPPHCAKPQCLTQKLEPVSSLTFESAGSRALNPLPLGKRNQSLTRDHAKSCAGGLNLSHAFAAPSLELIHFFFLPLQGVSLSPIVTNSRKATWLLAFLFLTVQASYIKFLGIIKRKHIFLW